MLIQSISQISRFATHNSQLTTHNSQLTTHNSQLTTHNSQLTILVSRMNPYLIIVMSPLIFSLVPSSKSSLAV
jgi:hypothetical protein